MALESVALIARCAECEARWLPTDEERWLAYLGGDDLDDPGEVVFYCPDCANGEFGWSGSCRERSSRPAEIKAARTANLKRRV